MATRKEEKKIRQKEKKANAKKVEVVKNEVEPRGKEEVITINHINHLPPQQARSIVWCPRVNRFVQKISRNHEPLNLEIETLHGVEIKTEDGGVKTAKIPITRQDRRRVVETNNCPDTGASITISGRSLMKKMGITQDNLVQDNTRVSAAEGSTIKVWGFLPVKLKVMGQKGVDHESNECLYFAEGVVTTLISLGALKNLGCVSKNFPYPEMETASFLPDRDDRDDEEEE